MARRKNTAKKAARRFGLGKLELAHSITIEEPIEFGNHQESGPWRLTVRPWGNRDHRQAQKGAIARSGSPLKAAAVAAALSKDLEGDDRTAAVQRVVEELTNGGAGMALVGEFNLDSLEQIARHVVSGFENVFDVDGEPTLYTWEDALELFQITDPTLDDYVEEVEIEGSDEAETLKIPAGTPLGEAWLMLIAVRSRAVALFREAAQKN